MPIEMPNTPNPTDANALMRSGRRGMAMLWQVLDHTKQPLSSHLLAMHVNPTDFDESFTKSKNVVPTYGGFIEYVWQDELDSISATASTGGFINPNVGLTAASDIEINTIPGQSRANVGRVGRQATMAWERQEDLLDIFMNNGMVFDGRGIPVIAGSIRCIYDRGIYIGYFDTFSVKETNEKAFAFELSWEFKVTQVEYTFPEPLQSRSEVIGRAAGEAARSSLT